MRIRWRSRHIYKFMIRKWLIRCPREIGLCVKFCRYHTYVVLMTLLLLFLWWNAVEVNDCGAQDVFDTVCEEFQAKDVAGNLCKALCDKREIKPGVCYKFENGIKSFRHEDLVNKVASNYEQSWRRKDLPEGLSGEMFSLEVKQYIEGELGIPLSQDLINGLFKHADVNHDDKLNLGEAQNLWRLIHQPFFLIVYLFQDLSVFPTINGTCGGLSVWNYGQFFEAGAGYLFDRRGMGWTVGFFSNNSYRWTLPTWFKRAKVVMGLLELVTEFYDRQGGRFHLCNMNGLTLFHTKKFELSLTEASLPLSGLQISNALRNVSCRSWRDCTLTPQCQTQCDYASRKCTSNLVKPTLSHACGVVFDYLLFDAPSFIKPTLNRLLRRCMKLTWSTPDIDLQHSLLALDIRDVIWGQIHHQSR